jgi:hypothetical protein
LTLRDAMVMKHMPKHMREQDPDERAALLNTDEPPPYSASPALTPFANNPMSTDLLKALKAGQVAPPNTALHNIAPELRHAVATPPRSRPLRQVDVGVIEIEDEDEDQGFSVRVVSTRKDGNAIDVKTERQELNVRQASSPTMSSTHVTLGHTRSSSAISAASAATRKRKPSVRSAEASVQQKRRRRDRGDLDEMSAFEKEILANQTRNREAFAELKEDFKAISDSFASTSELVNVFLRQRIVAGKSGA